MKNPKEYIPQLKAVIDKSYGLPEKAWNDFQKLFSYDELKKGEYFVEENTFTSKTGFVIEGVIRAFYRNEKGTEYNKTFFIENMFAVSFAAVLSKKKSYLNFQALENTKLIVADYYEIEKLFEKHRDIETLVRKIIEYEWVIKKEQRELRLVLNSAEERYKFFKEEYPGLENRIPQYYIASHLGVTPIQLSRIRAKLATK